MEEKKTKTGIIKKDIVFVIAFEIFIISFIYLFINNNLSNCTIRTSELDNIYYNILLYMPLVVMPLFFIFSSKKLEKNI